MNKNQTNQIAAEAGNYDKAIFAGGCFWCMEQPFEELNGVIEVVSGYCGGKEKNPTYEQVSSGKTSHAEAVMVYFDSSKISYSKLLEVFWRNINPTQKDGQFYDRGRHYRTAIFYLNEQQKKMAQESKKQLQNSGKFDEEIVTEIVSATEFYAAEEYHQDYYKKNPLHYNQYKVGSGRDAFIKNTWGKK